MRNSIQEHTMIRPHIYNLYKETTFGTMKWLNYQVKKFRIQYLCTIYNYFYNNFRKRLTSCFISGELIKSLRATLTHDKACSNSNLLIHL